MRNKLIYAIFFVFCMTIILQSCQNEEGIKYRRYYVNGKGLYEKNCQGCHGADGSGLGTLYPPLTDINYLIRNKSKLACIIRYGQSKAISINTVPFQGKMPGYDTFAEIDIAQLIVYITNSFGNKQGFYGPEAVAKDLNTCN